MVVNIGSDDSLFLSRQPSGRYYFSEILHPDIGESSAEQTPCQKALHQLINNTKIASMQPMSVCQAGL